MILLLMMPLLVTMLSLMLEFTTCERFSSPFFFFGCPLCFGLFVNLISEQFSSNLSREQYF